MSVPSTVLRLPRSCPVCRSPAAWVPSGDPRYVSSHCLHLMATLEGDGGPPLDVTVTPGAHDDGVKVLADGSGLVVRTAGWIGIAHPRPPGWAFRELRRIRRERVALEVLSC